ncbi:transcription elongation factor spt6 [Anaeramoeba flamelloides]|uniref:Transcription elongation factor spt6 n=1 Tax=Anaeramoeba flamelloides TaxID=1746091 RepID=A0AAV7YUF9_9EUKA|nr:transcription elongation factor spt6 [Anaeramoeba flamelloides]
MSRKRNIALSSSDSDSDFQVNVSPPSPFNISSESDELRSQKKLKRISKKRKVNSKKLKHKHKHKYKHKHKHKYKDKYKHKSTKKSKKKKKKKSTDKQRKKIEKGLFGNVLDEENDQEEKNKSTLDDLSSSEDDIQSFIVNEKNVSLRTLLKRKANQANRSSKSRYKTHNFQTLSNLNKDQQFEVYQIFGTNQEDEEEEIKEAEEEKEKDKEKEIQMEKEMEKEIEKNTTNYEKELLIEINDPEERKLLSMYKKVIDPTELEQRFLTIQDYLITKKDIPERVQIQRRYFQPFNNFEELKFPKFDECTYTQNDLLDEAEWIAYHAFCEEEDDEKIETISKILSLFRIKKYEVPFIQTYCKFNYQNYFNDADIWTIYYWSLHYDRFSTRKKIIKYIYTRKYQLELAKDEKDENTVEMLNSRIEFIEELQTNEELDDMFLCYNVQIKKLNVLNPRFKNFSSKIEKFSKLIKMFGLTPQQFGENLEMNQKLHNVKNPTDNPVNHGLEYLEEQYPTLDKIFLTVRSIIEQNIASEPSVRQSIRELFIQFIRINVTPTELGEVEIDYTHPFAGIKYIKDKPIQGFKNEQFILILQAEKKKLVKVTFDLPIRFSERNENEKDENEKDENDENDENENKENKIQKDGKKEVENEDNENKEKTAKSEIEIQKDEEKKNEIVIENEKIRSETEIQNEFILEENDDEKNNIDGEEKREEEKGKVEEEKEEEEEEEDFENYYDEFKIKKILKKISKFKNKVILNQLETLYLSEKKDKISKKWNFQRRIILYNVLTKYLFPYFEKEIRAKLEKEAIELIAEKASVELEKMVRVGPFRPSTFQYSSIIPYQKKQPYSTVMSCCIIDENNPLYCVMIDKDGNVGEHLTICNLQFGFIPQELSEREQSDLIKINKFIQDKLPDVIVIGCNLPICRRVYDYFHNLVERVESKEIHVTFIDPKISRIYMNTQFARMEFPKTTYGLKYAISIGRRIQDPLVEICRLCSESEFHLLGLKLHPLQHFVPKKRLKRSFDRVLIDIVNEVGVNVETITNQPHKSILLSFVCGLGKRKAKQILSSSNRILRSRKSFLKSKVIGENIYNNCIGFLKFIRSHNPLDLTRVHPSHYAIAMRIIDETISSKETVNGIEAVTAMETGLETETETETETGMETETEMETEMETETEPETETELKKNWKIQYFNYLNRNDEKKQLIRIRKKLIKLLQNPDLINLLDLKSFAHELSIIERNEGVSNNGEENDESVEKQPTKENSYETIMEMIKREIFFPFYDHRERYSDPSLEVVFDWIVGSSEEAFQPGIILDCTITKILEKGTIVVRVRNQIFGMISKINISDEMIDEEDIDAENQTITLRKDTLSLTKSNKDIILKRGTVLKCKILDVHKDRFLIELSCKESDVSPRAIIDTELQSATTFIQPILPYQDGYYDKKQEMESFIKRLEPMKKEPAYISRVIVHPNFFNINHQDAIEKLEKGKQGDVVFRPSLKGIDHLTISWKFAESMILHHDIVEEQKPSTISLGRILKIKDQSFNDLNEIISLYIAPMAALAKKILQSKIFKNMDRSSIHILLKQEKEKNPKRIPYYFILSDKYRGRFELWFLPFKKPSASLISITQQGYRFQKKIFNKLSNLIKFFKIYYSQQLKKMKKEHESKLNKINNKNTSNSNNSNQNFKPRMESYERPPDNLQQVGATSLDWGLSPKQLKQSIKSDDSKDIDESQFKHPLPKKN